MDDNYKLATAYRIYFMIILVDSLPCFRNQTLFFMKKKIFAALALTCILQLLPGKMFASHIIGNSITYATTGMPNTYLVTMKLYRDCSGIPAPVSPAVCYSSMSAGLSGTVTLTLMPGSGIECQPSPCVTGNGVSSCIGGTNFAMEEYTYQGMLTFPQAAADWILSYSDCCRNGAISTLLPNSSYIHTTLDNLNYPNNSSPQFITPPFAQYCLNTLSTFSFTCMDPDGDSLVYSLVQADDNATSACPPGTPVSCTYNAPYSATNPVSSSSPLVFDPATGSLTFTPDILQIAVVAMIVQEYRNGILIGEVKRDDEISVVDGFLYTDNITGMVYRDNNTNQVFDAGDQHMHGTIVEALPGPIYASTFANGAYSLPCMLGNYTVTIPNIPLYYVATPPVNTASFSIPNVTDPNNDFALSAPYNAQDLRVLLTGTTNCVPGGTSISHITYANVGTLPMSGTVSLTLDTSFVYDSSSVVPGNINGNVFTWNFTNLLPSSFGSIDVMLDLPSSVPLTTPLLSYVDISPLAGDSAPNDNSDTLHQLAAASYDPNEKMVEPSGFITSAQIAGGQYLEYTVFFQNTGNAPALTVVIDDTLDQNLNVPSFQMLAASHPYTWSMRGNGIIEFRFDNINLPDSNANEPASHGFVRYRVRPKNNLVTGDKMLNTAYIIFDINVPVVTNTTSTTVINTSSVSEDAADFTGLFVYPNPTNNLLTIEMNLIEQTPVNIQLYNSLGLLLSEEDNGKITGPFKKQISLRTFAKGLYFIKLTTRKGVSVVKVFVE